MAERTPWTHCVSARVTGLEERLFAKLGAQVGKRPVPFVVGCALLYLVLLPGILLVEGDDNVLGLPMDTSFLATFTLTDSEEYKEYKAATAVFPDIRGVGLVQTPVGAETLLSAATLRRGLGLDKLVTEGTAQSRGKTVKFGDVCARAQPGAPCRMLSAASTLLGMERSLMLERLEVLEAMEANGTSAFDRALYLVDLMPPANRGLLEALVGAGGNRPFPGKSAGARSLASWLLLGKAMTARFDLVESHAAMAFERAAVLRIYDEWGNEQLRASPFASSTIGSECARIGTAAVPLLIVAIGSMVLYVVLFLGAETRGKEDTQILMVLVGIGIPAFSALASFGAVGYMGMNLNVLAVMAPFLGLAVGVDAVFLVVTSINSVPEGDDVLSTAVSRAGVAATTTTLTSVLAFGVSAITTWHFPGFFVFNILVVVLLSLNWLGMVVLLPACAALNERRIAAGRLDLLPCVKRKGSSGRPGLLRRLNMGARGRALFAETFAPRLESNLSCQVVGASIWLVLFVGGAILAPQLGQGMPDSYFVVDDSPVHTYFDDAEAAFGKVGGIGTLLYLPQPRLGSPEYRSALLGLVRAYSERPDTAGDALCWPAVLAQQLPATAGVAEAEAAVSAFFADAAMSAVFAWDARTTAAGAVDAARCHFPFWQSTDSKKRAAQADEIRKMASDAAGLSASLYHASFPIAVARYNAILEMVLSSAGYAVVAVMVSLLLTLPVHLAFLAIVNVLGVILFLFGFCVLMDIDASAMSFSVVLMAIGFCVDYSCHTMHFSEHNIAPKTPWNLRMGHSLRECGFDVFQGCSTAFLGVALLGLNAAEAFRIFAAMALAITGVGGMFALWGLPAMLALTSRLFGGGDVSRPQAPSPGTEPQGSELEPGCTTKPRMSP